MAIVTLGISLSTVNTARAAIIPYTIINKQIFFLLGRDQRSGDITDFGGGVKKYESTLAAAFREFNEESDEVFRSFIQPNLYWRSVALLDDNMGVLFLPLPPDWKVKSPHLFNQRKEDDSPRKKSHSEIKELQWINKKTFWGLIRSQSKTETMWTRIRSFYRENCTKNLVYALRIAYPY